MKSKFYSPISSLIFCDGLVMLAYVEKCKLKKRLFEETLSIWFSNF